MYSSKPLNLNIQDSLLDPSGSGADSKLSIARTRDIGGRTYYKTWIYATGVDLPYVDYIEYTLHPTFTPQVHRVARTPSNADCRLMIWTWGLFDVTALVVDKQGNQYRLVHPMDYDKMFGKVTFQPDGE